jgi:hypothetical protein
LIVVDLPRARAMRMGAVGLVVAAALAACGGGPAATPSPTTPAGAPTGRGAFDATQMQKIRDCLSAAGISLPTPSGGFRTFTRSARPTTQPSDRPSRTGSGGARFGQEFSNPAVRAALQACGIALPTRPPGSGAGPVPTTTG